MDADSKRHTNTIEILSIKRRKNSHVSIIDGKRRTSLHFEKRIIVDNLIENRQQAGINIDHYLKSMFAGENRKLKTNIWWAFLSYNISNTICH